MGCPTYSAQALVLRKTKLGESDFAITLLSEDGSQIRAVAKGARKPSSPFAARLELYSHVELLLARGRSLDIVKEARLLEGNAAIRRSLELSACAAPGAELLGSVSQAGLENPRLFALSTTALASMAGTAANDAPTMSAAWLLKALAFAGLRPCFARCVCCGREIDLVRSQGLLGFSYLEGGSVCAACAPHCDSLRMDARLLAWADALLRATFADIRGLGCDLGVSFEVLRICQQWVRSHVGVNLKSLDFLFTCGLF